MSHVSLLNSIGFITSSIFYQQLKVQTKTTQFDLLAWSDLLQLIAIVQTLRQVSFIGSHESSRKSFHKSFYTMFSKWSLKVLRISKYNRLRFANTYSANFILNFVLHIWLKNIKSIIWIQDLTANNICLLRIIMIHYWVQNAFYFWQFMLNASADSYKNTYCSHAWTIICLWLRSCLTVP